MGLGVGRIDCNRPARRLYGQGIPSHPKLGRSFVVALTVIGHHPINTSQQSPAGPVFRVARQRFGQHGSGEFKIGLTTVAKELPGMKEGFVGGQIRGSGNADRTRIEPQ